MNYDIEDFQYDPVIENGDYGEWLNDECDLFAKAIDNILNDDGHLESLKDLIEMHGEEFSYTDPETLMYLENVLNEAVQSLKDWPEMEEERIRFQKMMDDILADNKFLIDEELPFRLSQLVENNANMVT